MKLSCCSLGKNDLIRIAMSDHRNQDFIELLKHIAHPIRLKLLQILTVESEILTSEIIDIFTDLTKEITDTEGNPKYNIENPQPFITRQLTKLKKSGILETKKYRFSCENDEWKKISDENGKYTAYRIASDKKDLVSYLLKPSISDKFQPELKVIAMKIVDDNNDLLDCLRVGCGPDPT
ncbi:MAG: ArsR/SmtB family transcription factor [Candidatus Hodarchaeales archaeon]|jgi:DNA-binding transcriptional ArsR family regulator